jgi:hypothetical protein
LSFLGFLKHQKYFFYELTPKPPDKFTFIRKSKKIALYPGQTHSHLKLPQTLTNKFQIDFFIKFQHSTHSKHFRIHKKSAIFVKLLDLRGT